MKKLSRREAMTVLGGATAGAAVLPRFVWAGVQQSSDEPAFQTAIELATRIRDKKISSVELTRYFIDRIERQDKALNAVPVRDFDRAMEAAKAADAAQAQGRSLGPLHGLPMTIKESFDIAGLPTTWGLPDWKDNVPTTDSAMVRSFKRAGAHFMGKTNVPLMLGDFQAYNDIYGTTNNPWNVKRIPGGSSGGTAAALAAGMTGLDSGSDIGGSIRNPAHFCGVYGLKPTWGIISGEGHSPLGVAGEVDLAVVGPMGRSAEDLALALELTVGPNSLDAPGWRVDLPKPRARSLKEMRVAVWPTDPLAPVDDEIAERSRKVASLLGKLGAKVSDTARPEMSPRDSHFVYSNLLFSVLGAGAPNGAFEENLKLAASFANDDRSIEAVGARAMVLSHRSWIRNNTARTRLRATWKEFFKDWDVLVCPIMPTTAFLHDHRPFEERSIQVNGERRHYWEQVFWAGLITVAGLPSTVFPTGPSKAGLPIGLQAVSAAFDDHTTIEFARLLAREMGGFVPPPGSSG